MTIADRIPGLTDSELAVLRDNAERLVAMGKPKQIAAATAVLPVIANEIAIRKARRSTALAEARVMRAKSKAAAPVA